MVLLAIADEILRFKQDPRYSMFPGLPVHYLTWTTAEAAETALVDTAVSCLYLRHDMEDNQHVCKLIEFLEAEAGSTTRAQIDIIYVVSPTDAEARPLMDRLKLNTPYVVLWQPLLSDLFTADPADSITGWDTWTGPPRGTPSSSDVPGTDFHYGVSLDTWLTPGCGTQPRKVYIDSGTEEPSPH